MKTILKPLKDSYVRSYSDLSYGILGRNEAVIALKQLINSFKSKELLLKVDKIKPAKDPQQSLVKLLDWLRDINNLIYFRAENGKNYIGYTDVDSMQASILAFNLDFLPVLTKMNIKLANLALRACYAFAGYHNIGEIYYGNRIFNIEWIYDGLEQSIIEGPANPSDEAKKEYNMVKETWISYKKEFPKYTKRFEYYSRRTPKVEDIEKQLDNFICDYRLQFIVDTLKSMMSLCYETTISEYADNSLNIFFEVNEYEKDEDGYWIVDDSYPLSLLDRVMLTWGGSDVSDYVFCELESTVNSFGGEFGYAEYSKDILLEEHVSLNEIISDLEIDKNFFIKLESIHTEFYKMRNKILFGNLINEIQNANQLRSNKCDKNLQTNTLF